MSVDAPPAYCNLCVFLYTIGYYGDALSAAKRLGHESTDELADGNTEKIKVIGQTVH